MIVTDVMVSHKIAQAIYDDKMMCVVLADIDECHEDVDSCQQECYNTVGSYTCSCRAGYRLRDGHNCDGIN